jgi:hypothetical protein
VRAAGKVGTMVVAPEVRHERIGVTLEMWGVSMSFKVVPDNDMQPVVVSGRTWLR